MASAFYTKSLIVLMTIAFCTACGVKGPPLPPLSTLPIQQKDSKSQKSTETKKKTETQTQKSTP